MTNVHCCFNVPIVNAEHVYKRLDSILTTNNVPVPEIGYIFGIWRICRYLLKQYKCIYEFNIHITSTSLTGRIFFDTLCLGNV